MLADWKQKSVALAKQYEANPTLASKLTMNGEMSETIGAYIENGFHQESIVGIPRFQKIFNTNFKTDVLDRALTVMRTEQTIAKAEISHVASEPENLVNTHLDLEGAIKRAGLSTHLKALEHIATENPEFRSVGAQAMSADEETLLYQMGFVEEKCS